MKRAIIGTVVLSVVVDLALVLGQYGIRLKEKPCTHLTGIGIYINYETDVCPRFRWHLAIP